VTDFRQAKDGWLRMAFGCFVPSAPLSSSVREGFLAMVEIGISMGSARVADAVSPTPFTHLRGACFTSWLGGNNRSPASLGLDVLSSSSPPDNFDHAHRRPRLLLRMNSR
jgi:hypothetical protein